MQITHIHQAKSAKAVMTTTGQTHPVE